MENTNYPDVEIVHHNNDFRYDSHTNGYRFSMKVFSRSQNKYIGWIATRNLGCFDNLEVLEKYPPSW